MPGSNDLMEGITALNDTQDAYLEAARYYDGTIAERFANQAIRRLVEQSGAGYRFRLSKIPVDVMANRVSIAAITSDSARAAERIEVIRTANDLVKLEPHIHRKLFTYGDAYALVWPVGEFEDQAQVDGETVDVAADDALREAGVEISYQSPLACRVIYDSEDQRRPRFAIRRWLERTALGKVWRAEVWYADRIEQWTCQPDDPGTDAATWAPYAEDETGRPVPVNPANWPLEHPWGEIPIKHASTDLPYGKPEHIDAYGPQDAITKAIVTQVVVDIEAHGWPERFRLIDDQKVLDTARDAVQWDDAAEAGTASSNGHQLPEVTGRQRGAGREHVYAGTKSVGEFSAPDPGALIEPIEQWVRLMSTVTGTPLYEFDTRSSAQLSGVARDKADAPLRAKERNRKLFLQSFWREVWTLALRMDGIAEPGAIDVNWTPPEVVSDPEWWNTAKVRLSMGVPIRQILAEANYLPEQADEWLNEQGEEMALIQKVELLKQFGEATQSIGAGVALGVVGQAEAQAFIARIMQEATGDRALPAA